MYMYVCMRATNQLTSNSHIILIQSEYQNKREPPQKRKKKEIRPKRDSFVETHSKG